jgi:hypothetical protein
MCGECVGLTNLPPSVSRLSTQCRILNILQPYRPLLFLFARVQITNILEQYLRAFAKSLFNV